MTDAIVASLFTLPFVAVAILVPALERHDPGARAIVLALGILFGGAGVVFSGFRAVHLWRAAWQYRRSVLVLETIPGVVGGHLAGTVNAPVRPGEGQSFCCRETVTSSSSGETRRSSSVSSS